MKVRARQAATVAVVFAWALAGGRTLAAGPLEYSYEVARFEVDGNVLGPQDGAPDFVDEFTGTTIAPNWYQAYGTVSEHDGSLFLTSPGAIYPSPTGGTTTVSIAAGASNTWVYDGDGNFTATAFWEPIIPTEGYHYHFSLFTFGGGPGGIFSEIFGIGFGGINGGLAFEHGRRCRCARRSLRPARLCHQRLRAQREGQRVALPAVVDLPRDRQASASGFVRRLNRTASRQGRQGGPSRNCVAS
jgi:hypothetical protein